MSEPPVNWQFASMIAFIARADPADSTLIETSVWRDFVKRLGEAGDLVLSRAAATPADRASALQAILAALEFGMRVTMGATNPYRPAFSPPWRAQAFDWGGGNPDAVYRTVNVRDDATYRITGVIGNAGFSSFEFLDGSRQTGSLVVADLRPDAHGRFEVSFGPHEQPGNWLRVVPGTSTILWREFFGDWASARPTRMRIDCIDHPAGGWPPLTADYTRRQFDALGRWMVATLDFMNQRFLTGRAELRNSFRQTATRADSDLPYVYDGYYVLGPDEALVIETPAFPSKYWGMQLTNPLWTTTNFTDHHSSLNNSQTRVDSDGMVRMVVAHRDPGVANWLDTCGITEGQLFYRIASEKPAVQRTHRDLATTAVDWMRDLEERRPITYQVRPAPKTRVVPLAQLVSVLPADTARVTPQQRAQMISERNAQILAMQAC